MTNVIYLKRPILTGPMRKLARIDAMWMRAAADALEQVDTNDREAYRNWIQVVSQRLGTCEEMALTFGVSTATYSRWTTGASLPQAYARQGIIDHLRRLLLERAEMLAPLAPPSRPKSRPPSGAGNVSGKGLGSSRRAKNGSPSSRGR